MTDQDKELLNEIEELRNENGKLKEDINYLESENRTFERENDRLSDEVSDLEDEVNKYESIEPKPEFASMVDQEKYDLFMEHYTKFTLEQFEQFLKPIL